MSVIDKKKNSGIYAIQCLPTGKSYVVSTKNLRSRKAEHFRLLRKGSHPNIYLQRAWNKHKESAFVFVVLEYCSQQVLIRREQIFIDKMKAFGCGYNLRPKAASNAGWKQTKAQRLRASKAQKGKVLSEDTKKKISEVLKGRVFSKEHREKLSKLHKGRKKSKETRRKLSKALKGRVSNRKGAVLSEETRRKIGQAQKGRKVTEETKVKLRARKCSESTREKMSKSQKERWEKVTEKQKNQRQIKILKATTHKQRSEAIKRAWITRRAS